MDFRAYEECMARFEPDSEKGKKMNWRQMSVESRDDDAVTLLQMLRCVFKDTFEDDFGKKSNLQIFV